MWHTEAGDRAITGDEAKLFVSGLSSLLDRLDGDESHVVGVPVFDKLSLPEKFAVLDHVSDSLLDDSKPSPKSTAVVEGALAAAYHQIMIDVEVELDDSGDFTNRDLIANACKCDEEVGEEVPPRISRDLSAWIDCVEAMMDRLLWDRDFMYEYVKPDDAPEQANRTRDLMRVDPDYYTDVPPDPTSRQLARIKSRMDERIRNFQ